MDMAKMNQRTYSFRFTAKSAMKQLKNIFLSIFWWQTQGDRSTRRIENSRPLKRGHFSVVVLKNGEPKKLLNSKMLLDAAEEEYGFNQKGALVIPCEATELEKILS
ncbi:Small auxin-up RNA - like 10 [Theobroma cacao]|nr:Small auxin-up RNA - like 10 [Theobroma cacao]